MLTYPNLVAAVASWGSLDELAEATGLPPRILDAVLTRGVAASLAVRARVARVLDADPVWLFRLDDELEEILASAPSRFVADPAALRVIDRGAA